jgi:hypothetical protein
LSRRQPSAPASIPPHQFNGCATRTEACPTTFVDLPES